MSKHAETIPGMVLMIITVVALACAYSCEPAHAQDIGAVEVITQKDAKALEKNIRSLPSYQLRRTYKKGAESITIFQSDNPKAGKWKQIKYDGTKIEKLDTLKKAISTAEKVSWLINAFRNFGMAYGDEAGDTAYENIIAQDDYEKIWTYENGWQTSLDIQSASLCDGEADCRVHTTKTYDENGNSQGWGEWEAFTSLI